MRSDTTAGARKVDRSPVDTAAFTMSVNKAHLYLVFRSASLFGVFSILGECSVLGRSMLGMPGTCHLKIRSASAAGARKADFKLTLS